MSAREPADINRIEDAIINVERSALLLNLVVLHGDHLGADHATAVWQQPRRVGTAPRLYLCVPRAP